jgi:branched-chain amino acid transport system substrate-binding protein
LQVEGQLQKAFVITAAARPIRFNALQQAQLADFTKITGVKVPGLNSTTAYNAANIFLDCITRGRTDTSRQSRAALRTVQWTGAGGETIKFDRYGDIIGGAPVGGYLVKENGVNQVYDSVA